MAQPLGSPHESGLAASRLRRLVPTRHTIHRYAQTVGKIRMALIDVAEHYSTLMDQTPRAWNAEDQFTAENPLPERGHKPYFR